MKVLVCEDNPRVQRWIRRNLEAGGFVVRVVDRAEIAFALVEDDEFDLLLLDIDLPGMDGLALLERLRERHDTLDVLMLTDFTREDLLFRAMQLGACGYLTKNVDGDRLRDAISTVVAGGSIIDPRLARRFWNYFASERGFCVKASVDLTSDERDLLQLVARGLTNPEVADVLDVSRRSVKARLASVYRKLCVNTRVGATVEALKQGLIEL